jgi:hypothetical protein
LKFSTEPFSNLFWASVAVVGAGLAAAYFAGGLNFPVTFSFSFSFALAF